MTDVVNHEITDFSETRAGLSDLYENWENIDKIDFVNKGSVDLPWSDHCATSIHLSIRKDVKKEDGWVLLRHTLDSDQSVLNPYRVPATIALYNQASGDLKIFVYKVGTPASHSSALWRLYFSTPQSLMNGLNEVSVPTSYKFPTSYIWETSNAPIDQSSTITEGWNCFIIPNTAYDPSQPTDLSLQIITSGSIMTFAEAFGLSEGDITGKIYSVGSENKLKNVQSKIETSVGEGAEKLVAKILGGTQKTEESSTRALGAAVLGGLIKAGAGLILNGLFGKFSKPTYSEQNVRLSMKTTIDIKGKLNTTVGTGLVPYGFAIGKDSTGYLLGAWSLSDNPTIYMHPVGVLKSSLYRPESGQTSSDESEYFFATSGNFKADLVVNPQLKPHIIKYEVDCTPVYYSSNGNDSHLPQLPVSDYVITDYGTLGAELGQPSFMNYYDHSTLIYQDKDLSIQRNRVKGYTLYWNIWRKHGKNQGIIPLYKYMYAPDNADLCRGGQQKIGCKNYFVKVMVTMVTKFEGKTDTVVTSRTYKPKFEWDPNLVREYSGLSMQAIQGKAYADRSLDALDNGYFESVSRRANKVIKQGNEEEDAKLDKEKSEENGNISEEDEKIDE